MNAGQKIVQNVWLLIGAIAFVLAVLCAMSFVSAPSAFASAPGPGYQEGAAGVSSAGGSADAGALTGGTASDESAGAYGAAGATEPNDAGAAAGTSAGGANTSEATGAGHAAAAQGQGSGASAGAGTSASAAAAGAAGAAKATKSKPVQVGPWLVQEDSAALATAERTVNQAKSQAAAEASQIEAERLGIGIGAAVLAAACLVAAVVAFTRSRATRATRSGQGPQPLVIERGHSSTSQPGGTASQSGSSRASSLRIETVRIDAMRNSPALAQNQSADLGIKKDTHARIR